MENRSENQWSQDRRSENHGSENHGSENHGSENPPKSLGSSFPPFDLRDWSTAPIGNPRLDVAPSSTKNAYTGDVQGMHPFARDRLVHPENRPWMASNWPTAVPRFSSGNTSPNRAREGAPLDAAYYPAAQLQTRSAFGQRDAMPRGHTPTNSQGPANGAPVKFDELRGYKDGNDSTDSFCEAESSNRGFRGDRHGSQDNPYSNGILLGANSDADQQMRGTTIYQPFSSNPMHVKRSSLAGTNGGFPTQGASPRPFRASQTSDDELRHLFAKNLSLADGSKRLQNGSANNDPAYAPASFQFNPVSESWEDSNAHGNILRFPPEAYTDSFASPFANKRGAPADRGSPPGGTYPPIGSPKSYTGTPQPQVNNPWPAVASREPRLALEADRISQGQQQFLQHQVSYPNAFFNQNYILPAHNLHVPYGAAHPGRGPLQIPTIPDYHDPSSMNHYLEAAAMRSNRNLDPAKGIRSRLLEEFRACHKVNNSRYDLKVRCYAPSDPLRPNPTPQNQVRSTNILSLAHSLGHLWPCR